MNANILDLIKNEVGLKALIDILHQNKKEPLNLTGVQLDYLIRNTDLNQSDNNGLTPLMYIFKI
jgi:hypothetical protein